MILFLSVFFYNLMQRFTETDKPARHNLDEDKSVALLKCDWAPTYTHTHTMSLSGLLAQLAFFLE